MAVLDGVGVDMEIAGWFLGLWWCNAGGMALFVKMVDLVTMLDDTRVRQLEDAVASMVSSPSARLS